MEPSKTNVCTLPQHDLTQPAEGCLSGLRPADLMLGGQEGANPFVSPRVAIDEAVDSATAGAPQPPRVSASTKGEVPTQFTRLQAYNILIKIAKQKGKNVRPSDLPLEYRTAALLKALSFNQDYKNEMAIKLFVSKFTNKFDSLLKQSKRNWKYFTNKHTKILSTDFQKEFSDLITKTIEKRLISIPSYIPYQPEPGTSCTFEHVESDTSHPFIHHQPPSIHHHHRPSPSHDHPEPSPRYISDQPQPGPSRIHENVKHSVTTSYMPHHPEPDSQYIFDQIEPSPSNIDFIETDPCSINNSLNSTIDCESSPDSEPRLVISDSQSIGASEKDKGLCKRQQLRTRKRLSLLLEKEPPENIIKAFGDTVEVKGQKLDKSSVKDLEYVISSSLLSPTRPTKIATKLKTDPKPYTPKEALGLFSITRFLAVKIYD